MRFFAAFAIVALAEMATFFWVEARIGLAWALAIALTTALIGSYLVRRAGIAVLGRIRGKVNQAQLPGRELTHGAAILVAGAFLISPGFITDTLGFLLLIPSARDLIHSMVSKRFSDRFTVMTAGTTRRHRHPDDVIDVDVVDERPADGEAPDSLGG
jgi:UPF0716 protein FxsA